MIEAKQCDKCGIYSYMDRGRWLMRCPHAIELAKTELTMLAEKERRKIDYDRIRANKKNFLQNEGTV